MAHVLVTTDYLRPGDTVHRLLTDAGHSVAYDPSSGPRRDADALTRFDGADAAILASEPVTPEMLKAATALKVIARSGVGFDSVDIQAATDHGIWVCNTPGVNHHAVAELAMGLMLTIARRLDAVIPAVRSGQWPRTAGTELHGRTLGIVGFGASGRATAELGRAFGMEVLVSTRYPGQDTEGLEFVDRAVLCARADYVSLHVEATAGNHHMVDAGFLEALKPTAVLVNTARGSLIDESALARALDDGRIAGAALDVLESETISGGSALRGRDDVVITSHLGGQTVEARQRAGSAAAENVLAVLAGDTPPSPVNQPAAAS